MSTMKCNPCCDNLKGRKAEFLILTIWLLRFRCIHLIAQHFHIPSRWFSPQTAPRATHKFSPHRKLDWRITISLHLGHTWAIAKPSITKKLFPRLQLHRWQSQGWASLSSQILPALGRHILYPSRRSCQRHRSQGGFFCIRWNQELVERVCLLNSLQWLRIPTGLPMTSEIQPLPGIQHSTSTSAYKQHGWAGDS